MSLKDTVYKIELDETREDFSKLSSSDDFMKSCDSLYHTRNELERKQHFLHLAIDNFSNASISRLENSLDSSRVNMLHLASSYATIIKKYILKSESQRQLEKKRHEVLKIKYKADRDLLKLARQLEMFSFYNVKMEKIHENSNQYLKCSQAFFDSFEKNIELEKRSIEIVSIMKLENIYLHQQFEKHRQENIDTSVVKGLFCLIPYQSLHSFCFLGGNDKSICNKWYHIPWFQVSANTNLEETLNLSKSFPNLQFSKSSINSRSINSFGIGCNVLCRVNITRLVDVDEYDPNSHQFLNSDVVLCAKSGFYHFLNPNCILPEFIITYINNTHYTELPTSLSVNLAESETNENFKTDCFCTGDFLLQRFSASTTSENQSQKKDLDLQRKSVLIAIHNELKKRRDSTRVVLESLIKESI